MPSIKALLFALFLFFLALLIVIVLQKKTGSTVQDADTYAMQNPNCSTVKIHSSKNSLLECFLYFESADDFPKNTQGADTLYIPMAKFIGERYPEEFPLRIVHLFSMPNEETDSIWISGKSATIARGKNPPWRNLNTGCKFPGPCPVAPLQNNAVNAILPGKVINIEKDEFYTITIYHGENIYSTSSGLSSLSDYAELGKTVSPDSVLGFVPLQDSKFNLEVRRNGKRERWF